MSHKSPSFISQRSTVPIFGSLVSVPNDVIMRLVYGTVELLAPAGDNAASVSVEVETGTNTDQYEVVFEEQVAVRAAHRTRRSFTFAVTGGRCYRFIQGGDATATEQVIHYSYVDL